MLQFWRNEAVKMIEDGRKDMEEKQKRKFPIVIVVIIRFFEIVLGIGVIGLVIGLLVLLCEGYFSYNVSGTITVKVNGEIVIADNVECYVGRADREYQKTKIKNKEDYVYIKTKAFPYANYFFEYEVDTGEGTKRFVFAVFKSHNAGPKEEFVYELDLIKEEGEWVAYVSFGDGYVREERILLSDDPDAFIETGP